MPSFTSRPMSVAEVSKQEKIPGRTVRHAILTGSLKANKLPGRTGAWLIYQRDLDKWLSKKASA